MSIVHLAILVLAAVGAFVFYSRFKERQAEEEGREDDEGSRLDIGVRSRMALHFWHPFVDRKVDEVAEGLLEALDPALRVDG